MKNGELKIKLNNTLKPIIMNKEIKYPQKYIPVKVLNICSNKIVGGGNLISINNLYPLIIGKGTIPLIWIYTKYDKNNWIPLVSENNALHSSLKIESLSDKREVIITIEETTIIDAKMSDDDTCIVNQIDLRPIGINLFGDENSLTFGTSKFAGNTFKGVSFMLGATDNKENMSHSL